MLQATLVAIPPITLSAIRAHGPCADGWRRLLAALDGRATPLSALVSLGDVALANGAADALWCIRALDWGNVALRRAVIAGCVLRSAERAFVHTQDRRVHDCIAALDTWCGGADVDLCAASDDAAAAARTAARDNARAAAWAAAIAVSTAASDVALDAAMAAMSAVAWAVASAAGAGADVAKRQAAWAAARDDIIAAAPPLLVKSEEHPA